MSTRLILTKKGESAVCGFHPWIFRGDVERIEGDPKPGDILEILTARDQKWLAWGFYEGDSNLCCKILSWTQEPFSPEWLEQKLRSALNLRLTLGSNMEHAFRWVHTEGDQLPGLIVDWFAGLCSVQITTWGMWERRGIITSLIRKIANPSALILQTETRDSQNTTLPAHHELAWGNIPENGWTYHQNGTTWTTQPLQAQKTGAYLDQRINHQKVASFAKNKNVWDIFCYTGGFSFAAAQAQAKQVLGVDRSEKALSLAQTKKTELNLTNLDFLQLDTKEFLEQKALTLEKPDLIVLDPPKLVTSNKTKDAGLRYYFRINELALQYLSSGGYLATFSCSGRVSLQEWLTLITSVLRRNKRQARILEILGAAPDHPVNPHLPESHYLKGALIQLA